MMKSIGTKVLVSFIGVEIIIMTIIWIGINFFIEDYYYNSKINDMKNIVNQIEIAYEVSDNPLELKRELEFIGYSFGGKISVYNNIGIDKLVENDIFHSAGNIIKIINNKEVTAYICETDYPTQNTSWLIYGEEMNNNYIAVLEVPVYAIATTLDIVKKFFNYIVIISILGASIGAIILSKSIANPILRLNKIAKEMGKLNFKEKYNGNRKDEIGQLGETLNHITNELEETIDNLKHELDKEKQMDVLRKSFVAQVSHELQTPLSVINGYVEALEDGMVETESERQYYYEIIEDEANKMSHMIKELLDLSQLEAGTFKMKMEEIDLKALIDRIVERYEIIANNKSIHLIYNGLEEPFNFLCDDLRIEQGITNIINNAFKHVKEEGKVIINIVKKEKYILLSIKNEGCKIDEDELNRIWDSFYKAKSNDEKQGTGLGLAIAAKIFKYHRIKYRAYNWELGVGIDLTFEV